MPRVNTLLNYFTKSPGNQSEANSASSSRHATPISSRGKSRPSSASNDRNLPGSCHRIAFDGTTTGVDGGEDGGDGCELALNNGKPLGKSDVKSGKEDQVSSSFPYEVFDLIWSKLEGFPYWPSIVCPHPKTFDIKKIERNVEYVHVQFFDDPPQRSWIKVKETTPYTGPTHPVHKIIVNAKLKSAIEYCEEASKLDKERRGSLIVELQLSDDDDSVSRLENGKTDSSDGVEKPKKRTPRKRGKSSSEPRKKARIIVSSDEEDPVDDEEYKPVDAPDSADESMELDDGHVSKCESPLESEDDERAVRKKKVKEKKRSKSSDHNSMLLASFAADDSPVDTLAGNVPTTFPHENFQFLLPSQRRDAEGRLVNDPNYDPKTLFVPSSFLKKQTPAHKQWWEMKARHFDTVLFFKVGKFYELFHMDAMIGYSELQLLHMRGEIAHCGFPERSYQTYADRLISRGYKVARVEQTEKPEDRDERCKRTPRSSKDEKVVTREICRITTPATRTCSVIDVGPVDEPSYLLAIADKAISDDSLMYAVTFVDTTCGVFYVGQFHDDNKCTRLKTLLAVYPPKQVLLERGVVLCQTKDAVNTLDDSTLMKEFLKPDMQFWTPKKTHKFLKQFYDTEGHPTLPDILQRMMDTGQQGVKREYELVFRSLGAVIHTLKECGIERQLFSMGQFEEYTPPDLSAKRERAGPQSKMIIDSVAIKNLEVFVNSSGGKEGTLISVVDNCLTKFGSRLMRVWLSSPLCNINAINERLDAVDDLRTFKEDSEHFSELVGILKQLPDLERCLTQIHAQGYFKVNSDHPDSRAVMFDNDTYSKKKIEHFLSVLSGFKKANHLFNLCSEADLKGTLLQNYVHFAPTGKVPDLRERLEYFDSAFDHQTARATGKIIPKPGVDDEYDAAEKQIEELKDQLEEYRKKQSKLFKCSVKYYGSGKNRYQLEIPEDRAKSVPSSYEFSSSRKGVKRYLTKEIKQLFSELCKAEDLRENALSDITRRMFEKFDANYAEWITITKCLALVDCLISLLRCSEIMVKDSAKCCRPVLTDQAEAIFSVKNSKHPCLLRFCDNFIPNDVDLDQNLMLITGPNMGGKSTLMRQCGLIAIMAQVGCYVPAESCRMTLVDRIFTRLGATDKILEGQSTFLVELNETSLILEHATEHSLVILDELGRGTSTYDGTGIACSVVKELSSKTKCRAMFSTHYHSLIEEFQYQKNIKFMHMACQVEKEETKDVTRESITFLYKLIPGWCPKSYGFNAAKLAGIQEDIVQEGFQEARKMEIDALIRKLLVKSLSLDQARKCLTTVQDGHS